MQMDEFTKKIPDKISVLLTEKEKEFFEKHRDISYSKFVRQAIDRAIENIEENEK